MVLNSRHSCQPIHSMTSTEAPNLRPWRGGGAVAPEKAGAGTTAAECLNAGAGVFPGRVVLVGASIEHPRFRWYWG